jgi:hypothetical protein
MRVILRSPALWDDEGSLQFAGTVRSPIAQTNCGDSSAPKDRGPQNDKWIQRARLLLNLYAVVIEGLVDQVEERLTRHLKVVCF